MAETQMNQADKSTDNRKTICVVTPCYNEVDNVRDLRNAIAEVFQTQPH